MKNIGRHTALALLLAACAGPVLAHPGWHGGALASGVLHPLTGLDHLLAMAAAGVWSARMPRQRPVPAHRSGQHGTGSWHGFLAAWLLAMLLGALAGMAGYAMPGLETALAATVVATGLLVLAAAVPTAAPLGMVLLVGFAALHGNAHGLELPSASVAGYLAGSALLLAAGRWLGARASVRVVRGAGAGIALAGVGMLA